MDHEELAELAFALAGVGFDMLPWYGLDVEEAALLCAILEHEREDEDGSVRFAVAQGLYWFCADHHAGMGSVEYRVMSTLGYRPGAAERGPDVDGAAVYDALVRYVTSK